MKKVFGTIAKTLYGLVVLAVVALAVLFIGTKIDFFGYEVRVVKSGSMEPAIMTGSVVLISSAKSYGVGDVITYETVTRNSIPVTHRIIALDESKRTPYYVTKGDANQDDDPLPVALPQVMGKVFYSLPYVGYAIEFARTPLGFALLIGIPAAVIILDEFADIMFELHKYRHALKRSRQGKTGYRTPSRDRRPRDASKPPAPKRVPQKVTGVRKRAASSQRPIELDLRNYELKRRSV